MIDDDNSAPSRGYRIKQARNLTNLSRKEFCDNTDINLHTLIGWECGRHSGLTSSGATKIVSRLAKLGVSCNTCWLLSNTGTPPIIQDIYTKSKSVNFSESENIHIELSTFISHYKNVAHVIIPDDHLKPAYLKGDLVAGISVFGDAISGTIGQICIVQLKNGELLVRKVLPGKQKNLFNLIHLTLEVDSFKIINDAQLNFSAPILWCRRVKT
jgi:transcriptional regulator with XRE-family HTH domain